MGPAGRPLINPSAMIIKTTAPPRGSKTINIATTMQLATIMLRGRLVRSARKPPEGTDATETHNTMLIVDPAAAIDQPRSTSIEGPKLTIMAKPTLNMPQIRPAAITAMAALRSRRRVVVAEVPAESAGGRYRVASSTMPHPIDPATAR